MSEEDAAEKSHEATPQKLEQARKKGEFPKSNDLTASASYLGLIISLLIIGPLALERLAGTGAAFLRMPDQMSEPFSDAIGSSFFSALIVDVGFAMAGLFGAPVVMVLIALTAQRAWVFAPEKIAPKLSRVSVISGAKNKFGANGLFEFAKSTTKLVLVSSLLVWFGIKHFGLLLDSTKFSSGQIFQTMSDLIVEFLLLIFVMMLLIGGVDYLWQVASHLRKNRMSRKELEDETKTNEGDPHHKQTRRQRGYEIAMNKMLAEVPNADVILVNPTHYAVALKWNRNSVGAPVCVAKGVDEIAARIREIADASNIPIHEDPPTARAVFATVEVDQQILPEHYRAVAVAIRFAEAMRAKAGPK